MIKADLKHPSSTSQTPPLTELPMTLLLQIIDGIEEAIACVERADHGINYVSGGDTERSLCVIREPLGHAHDALGKLRIALNDASERAKELRDAIKQEEKL